MNAEKMYHSLYGDFEISVNSFTEGSGAIITNDDGIWPAKVVKVLKKSEYEGYEETEDTKLISLCTEDFDYSGEFVLNEDIIYVWAKIAKGAKPRRIFKIPVEWSVWDYVQVEAETLEEAVHWLRENDEIVALGTEPEYIDGSYKINGDSGQSDKQLSEELSSYSTDGIDGNPWYTGTIYNEKECTD